MPLIPSLSWVRLSPRPPPPHFPAPLTPSTFFPVLRYIAHCAQASMGVLHFPPRALTGVHVGDLGRPRSLVALLWTSHLPPPP
jgi:hypothetical protein